MMDTASTLCLTSYKHSNTNKLKKYFGETHDMYIVPAFKEDTVVKPGWDKGDLATFPMLNCWY